MPLRRIASVTLTGLALAGLLSLGSAPAQATTTQAAATQATTAQSAGAAVAQSTDFYQLPSEYPATDGALIRQEPSAYYLDPLKLIGSNAQVTRIMYKSTNSQGRPMAVTGTVLVPKTAWLGKGTRPLISLAAGTQGQGDQCAPSKLMTMGSEYEGILLKGLLLRGYAVTITDYEGLGTSDMHTYLSRLSQGHAVLDAARAALSLGIPGINQSTRVGIAGYSQGGGAAASAAELASSYAPELNLMGTYAGAVPADLQSVASNIDGSLYTGFLLYAANGLLASEGIDPSSYFNAQGLQSLQTAAQQCIFATLPSTAFLSTAKLTLSGQKFSALTTSGTFKEILNRQKLGVAGAPKAPVLVGQSLFDDVVPAAQAKALAKRWCAAGSTVQYATTLLPTHVGGYAGLLPDLFAFMEARVAGLPASSNCRSL
ncbi:pimeloyl-ACP methyl ester carboxylesterase [Psychromicrobium silvestre]|uniref:Pimeloyl-ACP methyl ester carboxylesterase n=1 Tax=Psychromicrobium silvestre TaxID=1645614 RepID=A0A7Y9LV55_9MICC|nr:lipase family protein [Psychromicrobium silvestre]NYE96174.1 pimeloyl-ACP methyl ester carboxylesterase [Psychromicrobium silvestre]